MKESINGGGFEHMTPEYYWMILGAIVVIAGIFTYSNGWLSSRNEPDGHLNNIIRKEHPDERCKKWQERINLIDHEYLVIGAAMMGYQSDIDRLSKFFPNYAGISHMDSYGKDKYLVSYWKLCHDIDVNWENYFTQLQGTTSKPNIQDYQISIDNYFDLFFHAFHGKKFKNIFIDRGTLHHIAENQDQNFREAFLVSLIKKLLIPTDGHIYIQLSFGKNKPYYDENRFMKIAGLKSHGPWNHDEQLHMDNCNYMRYSLNSDLNSEYIGGGNPLPATLLCGNLYPQIMACAILVILFIYMIWILLVYLKVSRNIKFQLLL